MGPPHTEQWRVLATNPMTALPQELRPIVRRVPPREISHDDLQLLRLLATGLPVDSVARRLDLSERTVRRRTRTVCDRLGFGTAIEAIVWAARRGLV